jgi:hypothetical protein
MDVKGSEILDVIKYRNRSLDIYGASLLFILTKYNKLMFFNIDSLFKAVETSINSDLRYFEKIYGHQSDVVQSVLLTATS